MKKGISGTHRLADTQLILRAKGNEIYGKGKRIRDLRDMWYGKGKGEKDMGYENMGYAIRDKGLFNYRMSRSTPDTHTPPLFGPFGPNQICKSNVFLKNIN